MFTANRGRLALIGAVAVGAVVALAGCASGDPLDSGSSDTAGDTLIVGSQDYYSNEIIAEIYAQALEANDIKVERQFRIGQREVYLPEIKDGAIDVFPEYTGSLLSEFDPKATNGTSDDIFARLQAALPDDLRVLDRADASDQDTYTVTAAFAEKYNLTDIASLKNVTEPITVGANSEFPGRAYGTEALKEKYGIETKFQPIEDGGGPLTVKALRDGTIQAADIYTASPDLKSDEFVVLSDPDGFILANNVVPVVSEKVDEKAADVLNKVSAALSADDLVSLNAESVNEQKSAEDIAAAWLEQADLF